MTSPYEVWGADMGFTRNVPNGKDELTIKAKGVSVKNLMDWVIQAEQFYGRHDYVMEWEIKKKREWRGTARPAKAPPDSLTSDEATLNLWKRLAPKQQNALWELTSQSGAWTPANKLMASPETLDWLVETGFARRTRLDGHVCYTTEATAEDMVCLAAKAGLVEMPRDRQGG